MSGLSVVNMRNAFTSTTTSSTPRSVGCTFGWQTWFPFEMQVGINGREWLQVAVFLLDLAKDACQTPGNLWHSLKNFSISL